MKLSWFPYEIDVWDRRVRDLRLSLTDEAALMRLIRSAWRSDEPCTVRSDPDELARIVGVQWKMALPVLRAHFTPLTDRPTLLRCGWLYDEYLRQEEKHLSYQKRGRTGGHAKAGSGKAQLEAQLDEIPSNTLAQLDKTPSLAKAQLDETPSSAKAQLAQNSTEEELKAKISAPTGQRDFSTKAQGNADAALAPVGAALAAPNGTGNYQASETARAALQKRGATADQLSAEAARAPESAHENEQERLRLLAEYEAVLQRAADQKLDDMGPEEAARYEREVRVELGFTADGDLSPMLARSVRAGVVERIRRESRWRTFAQHCEAHRADH